MLCGFVLRSQSDKPETRTQYNYRLERTTTPVVIDGVAEATWDNVMPMDPFMNHWPLDTGRANSPTEVKISYDDQFIYIMAKCFDNGNPIIQSLRRDDNNHWNSDNITVVVDPMNNKQNGFMFGVNAGGAQIEALLNINGARTSYDENWDNKWYSKVGRYEDHWLVEMAIPFKTLRYSPDNKEWGINFIRSDMANNSYSTWTQFPLNYGGTDLNFMGTLEWDVEPKRASGNFVLIPYVAGGTGRDYEDVDQTRFNQNGDVGLDAKVALTGSLNMDLTINPDFSNVDVDQQVTNLTRFSIFLPERRNFFLENGDVFSNFGSWLITPFFSRRIGLLEGQQVPIMYGGRVTGNATQSTRIGLMNVQTRDLDSLAGRNYTVAAVHQQVLSRSVLKGIFINNQANTGIDNASYSRNGGMEFAYVSKNGVLNNTVRMHAATTDEELPNNKFYGFSGSYNGRKFRSGWSFDVVDKNYLTELGFNPRINNYNAETDEVVRRGFIRSDNWMVYRFFSEQGSTLNFHGPRVYGAFYFNRDGSGLNERSHTMAYDFQFANTSWLSFAMQPSEVNLPVPTSLLGDFTPLPVANYTFNSYYIEYSSDRRKVVSTDMLIQYGNFYTGDRFSTSMGLNFRAQPWGTFGITHDYNDVDLGKEYGSAKLHLVRVNTQISFSNAMFWTNAVQLNSQSDNFNFFSRFQWRFRPMSDFFVVYSDNYSTDNFNIKNRQLVFKLTFWMNG